MSETKCDGCQGVYRFDTSVPSVLWNRVMRADGVERSELLCAACIVRVFAKAGESFTATLFGDGFNGVRIEVQINARRRHSCMSELKATPGPWVFLSGSRSVVRQFPTHRSRETSVCVVSGPHSRKDERVKGNGDLIAAAPDLYAALDRCEDLLAGWLIEGVPIQREAVSEIRATVALALAKARGEDV